MRKTSFDEILSLLTPAEWKLFGAFLAFKKAEPRITKLYQALKPNSDRTQLAEKTLGKGFTDSAFRNLLSSFTKYLDEYLICKELDDTPELKKVLLLRKLRKTNRRERWEQKLKEAKKDISAGGDYYLSAKVHEEEFASETESRFHLYNPALQEKSDSLDYYYINQKLLMFQQMLSKQTLNSDALGYRLNMWEEIKSFIESSRTEIEDHHPELYIKFIMLKMMLDMKNDTLLKECEEYLQKAESMLPKAVISDYYSDLYNFITIRINEGEQSYRRKQFTLVVRLDSSDLLCDISGEHISYYNFKQISDTCIFLREFDWLEHFISKYASLLKDESSESIAALIRAKLNLYRRDYDKAKEYLSQVKKKDFIHYLDAQIQNALINYETGLYNETLLIADAIDKYIRFHSEIPEYQHNNTKLFLYYLRKLVQLNDSHNKEQIQFDASKLLRQLHDETKAVNSRKWIENVLNNIINT